MSEHRPPNSHNASDGSPSSRLSFLLITFVAIALIWAGRLVYLQVIKAEEYSSAAAASRTVSVDISPRRGTIYDRNGNVLATSVDATTVYGNPKEIEDIEKTASILSEVLGGDASDYRELLEQDTTFVYLKRKADVDTADALKKHALSGIYFLEDTKRVYPYGKVAGQVLGFVNVDGEGVSGLELYYDDILKGAPGKLVVQRGGGGIPIPGGTEVDEPAKDGQDIVISIDIDMQSYLEKRLAEGVEQIGGDDGGAVLMDASTGDLLAIASTPYFDPSDPSNSEVGSDSLKPVTQAYEPGSIFKTVSMTALLEAGAVTPDTTVFAPAGLAADEYVISDAHERGDMTMTARYVMQDSSNVGISLLVESYLGFAPLYDKIVSYGLNDATGIDYPGEAGGYLAGNVETWPQILKYNVTFGQGISNTPLQMTRFYGALINDGVAVTPHLLLSKPQSDEVISYETERIIENIAAIEPMISMLETVVEEGTGVGAAIEGYRVAGKTGTAEYVDEETGLYAKNSYNLDFVGVLPDASTPLVCFVGVNEVPYERNTTEVFKDIMTEAINRYRVVQSS
ncbi:MAG: penicillin-binding protein 2 [Slackia sp.]|nr:penicillin-binding protein 2 [Slackia sp.]